MAEMVSYAPAQGSYSKDKSFTIASGFESNLRRVGLVLTSSSHSNDKLITLASSLGQ